MIPDVLSTSYGTISFIKLYNFCFRCEIYFKYIKLRLQVNEYKDAEQQARKTHIGIWKYGDM